MALDFFREYIWNKIFESLKGNKLVLDVSLINKIVASSYT